MGRSKVRASDAAAIRDRLSEFVKKHYSSANDFEQRLQVPKSTCDTWRSAGGTSIPDTYWLFRIAQESNLSIDWLLLGQGPMLRHRSAQTPVEQLRRAVEAELRQTEGLPPDEFEAAWDRLIVRGDFQAMDEQVFKLAVEGVRERFHEQLRLARHYAGLAWVYEAFRHLHEAEMARDPERAEQARRRFVQLLAVPLDGDMEALWRIFNVQRAELGFRGPVREAPTTRRSRPTQAENS